VHSTSDIQELLDKGFEIFQGTALVQELPPWMIGPTQTFAGRKCLCIDPTSPPRPTLPVMRLPNFCRKELFYILVVALCGFSIGEIGTFNSPTGPEIAAAWNLSEWQSTVFNAQAHLCASLGGFAADFFITRWGRRLPCIVLMGGVLIGFVVIGVTRSNFFWVGFVARAFQGFFMGSLTTLAPMYIVELAPPQYRGAFGSFHQLSSAFGISYLNLLDIWCGWRLLSYLAAVIQVLFCIFVFCIPESPAVARTSELSMKEPLCQRKYLYGLGHTFALATFQQLAGMDAILTNLNSIFVVSEAVLTPAVCAYIVTLATIISGSCAAAVIQRLGRKRTWIVSAAGQMTGLLLAWVNDFWEIGGVLPIISFFIDILSYDLGMGPVPWIITPELFPDDVRPLACSLTTGFNWLLSSVIMFVWPTMRDGIGIGWSFLAFAVCCAGAIAYGVLWMPETKDKEIGHLKAAEAPSDAIEVRQGYHTRDGSKWRGKLMTV
jgi:MFS family permease